MAQPLVTTSVRVIGAEQVRRKLLLAEPHIKAHNRLMVTTMLNEVKNMTAAETPLGPAHFGYHGRDTLKVEVHIKGIKTIGSLRAAVQLGWRERGTSRGERARRTAHKALAGVRRFISAYYGGMAAWWRM